MMNRLPVLLLACLACLLGGCASSSYSGRSQLSAPGVVSNVYSEVNMRLMLVATPDAKNLCAESECDARAGFDQRVAAIGPRLIESALRNYPDLAGRERNFEFVIVDKTEPGTASTAAGSIIILRPVSSLTPGDEALAFILAREIGHVVAQHHEENTAASLIISILAQVIAPVTNIARIFSTLISGTAAGTGAYASIANASITAASFVGTKVVVSSYKPRQREEADAIAMTLLGDLGYDARAVTRAFSLPHPELHKTGWTLDLIASVAKLSAPTKVPGAVSSSSLPVLAQRPGQAQYHLQ